mmetsp:Transcript_9081/g.28384  ORF Transcript_9081/g.28384 Transcript_9081/m.28384 type:complete len:127 (+) Transcript_9081:170-550(+)
MRLLALAALFATADAFAISTNRLVAAQRRSAPAAALSMRYGKKQQRIRSAVKQHIKTASEVEDLASILAWEEYELCNRRMAGHVYKKVRKECAKFGYQIAFASAEDEELMDAMDDEEEAAEEPVAA